MLAEQFHVEVAVFIDPLLVDFDRESADQPQAARGVGKDAHHVGAPLQLLVQPLEHVGRLHVLVVLRRQLVGGQRLLDVLLDPVAERRVLRLPFRQPAREILPRLGELAAVVEPAQLLQAVVVGLARQVVARAIFMVGNTG